MTDDVCKLMSAPAVTEPIVKPWIVIVNIGVLIVAPCVVIINDDDVVSPHHAINSSTLLAPGSMKGMTFLAKNPEG